MTAYQFPFPTRTISSGFGFRRNPVTGGWKLHAGTDFAPGFGKRIRTIANGVVIAKGSNLNHLVGSGHWVAVRTDGDGVIVRYWHMREPTTLHLGQRVRRGILGTTIGFVGSTGASTGAHLHLQLEHHGVPFNAVPYIREHLASKTGVTPPPAPIPATVKHTTLKGASDMLGFSGKNIYLASFDDVEQISRAEATAISAAADQGTFFPRIGSTASKLIIAGARRRRAARIALETGAAKQASIDTVAKLDQMLASEVGVTSGTDSDLTGL